MTHRTPRIPISGERLVLHDRGKVLTQAMPMLAGGGVCRHRARPGWAV
jgi:hypothetical protein